MSNPNSIPCPTCVAKGDGDDDQAHLEVNPKLYVDLQLDADGEIVAIISGIEEDATVKCAHSEHVVRDDELDRKVMCAIRALEAEIVGESAR